ncbi:MAG: metal-dependent transcriptional regulator [Saprospiraceae bacterium]|nr:metal-dependent transcriptional regulator [Saprospiraceae bacterium]
MTTTVKENYLKALYFLDQEDSKINVTELSKRLDVSKPTASSMIKSLKERGWVKHERYRPIRLTAKGRKAAALIIRKHRLTEMFLHKVMGFGWEEVHAIAEQMEHIDSDKLFTRMDEMLDHPVVDPHGSPIPDQQGQVIQQKLQKITELVPGQRGKLTALSQSSSELLHYLNGCRIELGTIIQLVKIEAFDGSCSISCNGQSPITVSKKVAESLLIAVS